MNRAIVIFQDYIDIFLFYFVATCGPFALLWLSISQVKHFEITDLPAPLAKKIGTIALLLLVQALMATFLVSPGSWLLAAWFAIESLYLGLLARRWLIGWLNDSGRVK